MNKNTKIPKPDTRIIVYTDGGCAINPGGPGGYGVVIIDKDEGVLKEYSESYTSTTNNRMEVMAIIRAIKETASYNEAVTIISDSQYAINCATGSWKKNKNHDLWKEYDAVAHKRDIHFIWVKGHAGNTYNERCDTLATMAIQNDNKKDDIGYILFG